MNDKNENQEKTFEGMDGKEQLEHLKARAITDGNVIYGRVSNVATTVNYSFIAPYDHRGKRARLFKSRDSRRGIRADKRADISKDDFVKGKPVLRDRNELTELYIEDLERLGSEEDLRKELLNVSKKIWQDEGLTFEEPDLVVLDGKRMFSEWFSEEVMTKFEDAIKKKVQALQNEITEMDEQLQEKKERLAQVAKENEEAEETYQRYKALGIIQERPKQPCTKKEYICDSYPQLITDVWSYLWKEKHLYYEMTTIRFFMNALRTRQLIILWGRPGTGKTSLPRGVAQALGAECTRIQVQSNWTDNQDLLGYYNVVDKRYMPTQFLDALVAAKNDPERLHLILLDEMNLSNIEYYFSEMLNAFTWEVGEPYKLHLYPEKLLRDAENDPKANGPLKDMLIYRPEFEIPENVRFVGTLNTDATTKTISPKVIDRSCLIELQTLPKDRRDNANNDLPNKAALDGESWMVPARTFEIKEGPSGPTPFGLEPADKIWLTLDAIRKLFHEAGLSVSHRIDAYTRQWLGRADEKDAHVDPDEIVLGKILPLLNDFVNIS